MFTFYLLMRLSCIEKVIKLLRCAFHQAVRWDMIGKNPFEDADLPKREKKVRAIWTADIIRQALDNCQDGKLYIAINLAFACSMRIGAITGLTWTASISRMMIS